MSENDIALVVRKRTFYGLECWWIGRGNGKQFVLYGDIYAPTGYGFRSKAKAERIAAEIEKRLIEVAQAQPKRRVAKNPRPDRRP